MVSWAFVFHGNSAYWIFPTDKKEEEQRQRESRREKDRSDQKGQICSTVVLCHNTS